LCPVCSSYLATHRSVADLWNGCHQAGSPAQLQQLPRAEQTLCPTCASEVAAGHHIHKELRFTKGNWVQQPGVSGLTADMHDGSVPLHGPTWSVLAVPCWPEAPALASAPLRHSLRCWTCWLLLILVGTSSQPAWP
jgi:hypothetical protein